LGFTHPPIRPRQSLHTSSRGYTVDDDTCERQIHVAHLVLSVRYTQLLGRGARRGGKNRELNGSCRIRSTYASEPEGLQYLSTKTTPGGTLFRSRMEQNKTGGRHREGQLWERLQGTLLSLAGTLTCSLSRLRNCQTRDMNRRPHFLLNFLCKNKEILQIKKVFVPLSEQNFAERTEKGSYREACEIPKRNR